MTDEAKAVVIITRALVHDFHAKHPHHRREHAKHTSRPHLRSLEAVAMRARNAFIHSWLREHHVAEVAAWSSAEPSTRGPAPRPKTAIHIEFVDHEEINWLDHAHVPSVEKLRREEREQADAVKAMQAAEVQEREEAKSALAAARAVVEAFTRAERFAEMRQTSPPDSP